MKEEKMIICDKCPEKTLAQRVRFRLSPIDINSKGKGNMYKVISAALNRPHFQADLCEKHQREVLDTFETVMQNYKAIPIKENEF